MSKLIFRMLALLAFIFHCNQVSADPPYGGYDTLGPGQFRSNGNTFDSPNGWYRLEIGQGLFSPFQMTRKDGSQRITWTTEVEQFIMQEDGNFVAYTSWGEAKFDTGTAGNGKSTITIQDDGNLVIRKLDGTITWELGPDVTRADPSLIGDVVGRDLNIPGLGGLGHVAVWDGGLVVEATSGGANAIRYVTAREFRAETSYWGVASPNIPEGLLHPACYEEFCSTRKPHVAVQSRLGIQMRARQVYLIGADYTTTGTVVHASYADENRRAQRGTYRCDSFVAHMLDWSSGYQEANPDRKRWQRQTSGLAYSNGLTPSYLFSQVGQFK